jgi:fatty-acyl-CoA synthase
MPTTIRAYDWIAHHHLHRGGKSAIIDLHTNATLTYSDLHHRIDALSAQLQALGVSRGDRVALLAHNGPEYFDLQFAGMRIGSIAVLLNWRLTAAELEYILTDSSPMVLIHSPEFADTAAGLAARCGIAHLIAIDETYDAMLLSGAQPQPATDITHDDPSTIMYTSGTTGHPKGAIITHGMTFWNAVNLSPPARVTPDTVQLVVLPLFHTGGLNCYANPVLHAGGRIVIMRTFDPGDALRVIGDASMSITHFFGVPAPYQFMWQHPDFETTDLSRLQMAGVGGAPCALAIMEAWAERGINLAQGFGMTETSPASIFIDPDDALRKLGSTGKPLLHTEVRIVDEDGHDVGVDKVGELWTRGPNITPGYWNRPDATADAFVDGWLRTGDAARTDDEGFIYIVDRWKDMYISGGENVYPAEVENTVYQLPQIAEAAVVGVPDPKWGESGVAVVVLKEGAELDQATLIAHCVQRLAKFKVPARMYVVDALPRNATGKVLKRELRTLLAGEDSPAIS